MLTLTLAAVIAVIGLAASATDAAGDAACKPIFRTEPCLAPIQTGYAYDGRGGGDLSYIWAKPGPVTVVGEGTTNTPRPGTPYRITKRTFTWHSTASIKIVAVFVVQGLEPHMTYTRLSSGEHAGHASLTAGLIPPRLLIEGRHTTAADAQAASMPTTVTQCRTQFKHNRKARIACEKRVKSNAMSGCTLDTIWDGVGDGGDKQDYSVTLKTTGSEPGPYSVQVEVKILNPNVEICSGSVLWYDGNGATGQHSAPVTIGAHGGVSSLVSLPASADGVAAKVLGRLK